MIRNCRFASAATSAGMLLFDPTRARWVADEQWHPQQQSTWRADGRYELRVPFREDQELVMDILRHGVTVELIAPASLRDKIARHLRAAASIY